MAKSEMTMRVEPAPELMEAISTLSRVAQELTAALNKLGAQESQADVLEGLLKIARTRA